MNLKSGTTEPRNFGMAWLLLCLALCTHVTDEALTGFLPVYNATVQALRAEHSWYPVWLPRMALRSDCR